MRNANPSSSASGQGARKQITVVGAGTMGSGIAQLFAMAGWRTTLVDPMPGAVSAGVGRIEKAWQRDVSKGRASEPDVTEARSRLQIEAELEHAAGTADLIIEAIFEDRSAKLALFRRLSDLAPSGAVLASNTSSISITELAAVTVEPERVVGLHFFNPVAVLPLVEIVQGIQTSENTVERCRSLAEEVGKTAVVVRDAPGFVANRILMPMINEAIFCLSDGVADRDSIDAVMKLGMNHPIGPLALADLIGLDVCLQILEVLHHDFGDDKYRPAPLLRRMVAAGRVGRKAGRGFFEYDR
ncbi:MAG TPA: 3-hydroxyacyl-CoA dehydrogenase NAD-binding domain-containing protein [Thermomicrobiales bacterium]|nr:3-hydroxyacyl-CoA dehydrogenase NAD-binding domain-containing protein [Thermomicrobiales bacterium]